MSDYIKEKLEIVKVLFNYCYNKKLNHSVDNEISCYGSRAWNIAFEYLKNKNTDILTINNLRYINKIIKKLVSILGADETKINLKYIQDNKLNISFKPLEQQSADDAEIILWIDNYKALLKLIKENRND